MRSEEGRMENEGTANEQREKFLILKQHINKI
jgi:hypothetical protein